MAEGDSTGCRCRCQDRELCKVDLSRHAISSICGVVIPDNLGNPGVTLTAALGAVNLFSTESDFPHVVSVVSLHVVSHPSPGLPSSRLLLSDSSIRGLLTGTATQLCNWISDSTRLVALVMMNQINRHDHCIRYQ